MIKKLYILFIVLFAAGIILAGIGAALSNRDTGDYRELQEEFFGPDEIGCLLHDRKSGRLYVCYPHALTVNVYSESGEFLWAVSVPYMKTPRFALAENRLIIFDDDAYLYDYSDGHFLARTTSNELDLPFVGEEEAPEERFFTDSLQVYERRGDGADTVVVARPWWYRLFRPEITMFVSFPAGLGIVFLGFLGKRKEYDQLKKRVEIKKSRLLTYFCVTTGVHLCYGVLNFIIGFFGAWLCVGILPLTLHFIVLSIIANVRESRRSLSADDRAVLHFWWLCGFVSLIAAALSVFASLLIASALGIV